MLKIITKNSLISSFLELFRVVSLVFSHFLYKYIEYFINSCTFSFFKDICFSMPSIVTGEGLKGGGMESSDNSVMEVQRIHEENVEKLCSMSKEEILNEQTRLKQMIGKVEIKGVGTWWDGGMGHVLPPPTF